MQDAPTDVRHLEFIKYNLGSHVEFLKKLDNALHRVFIERYVQLYQAAASIFADFKRETGVRVNLAPQDVFTQRLAPRALPSPDDRKSVMEDALLSLVEHHDLHVTTQLTQWIVQQLEKSKSL